MTNSAPLLHSAIAAFPYISQFAKKIITLPMIALLGLAVPSADAAVIFSGDFTVGGLPPSLTIDAPITFTMSAAFAPGATQLRFVFDDIVTSDGGQTFVGDGSRGVDVLINGAPFTLGLTSQLLDNQAVDFGGLTANDGILWSSASNPVALMAGDTVTLQPQSWTFAEDNGFNASYNTNPFVFTGDLFIVESGTTQISNVVSAGLPVPEPATLAMLGAILTVIAGLRLSGGPPRIADH